MPYPYPLPTHLLKNNVDVFAPFLAELYNRSQSTGTVPAALLQGSLRYAAAEKVFK